jgi:hypothetical protein
MAHSTLDARVTFAAVPLSSVITSTPWSSPLQFMSLYIAGTKTATSAVLMELNSTVFLF